MEKVILAAGKVKGIGAWRLAMQQCSKYTIKFISGKK